MVYDDIEDDYDSYGQIPSNSNLRKIYATDLDDDDDFEKTIFGLMPNGTYYFRACVQFEDGNEDEKLVCGDIEDFETSNSSFDEPEVETHSGSNFTSYSALLEGELNDIGDADEVDAFFVLSGDDEFIDDIEDDYDSYGQIPSNSNLRKIYATDLDDDDDFEKTIFGLMPNGTYYFRACVQFEDGNEDEKLVCGDIEDFETSNSSFDEPEVETHSGSNFTSYSALLEGELNDIGDADEVDAFFVLSGDDEFIDDIEDDYDSYGQIPSNSNLRKIYATDLDDDDDFEKTIFGLMPNGTYYFRACVQFEDGNEDEKLVCGDIEDFETSNSSFDEPEVETHSGSNFTSYSALLEGELNDIGDADEVDAFFVLSGDDEFIDDIEDDYDSYGQIPSNSNLRKIYATDLDDDDDFEKTIFGLMPNGTYYFRACVQFEDGNEDEKLVCGDIEDFETL